MYESDTDIHKFYQYRVFPITDLIIGATLLDTHKLASSLMAKCNMIVTVETNELNIITQLSHFHSCFDKMPNPDIHHSVVMYIRTYGVCTSIFQTVMVGKHAGLL